MRITLTSLSTILLLTPGLAAAATEVFEITGKDAASIQSTVDDFRTALGENNGNAPVNGDPQGRRQIDWDAAPDRVSDPNEFPGDFFNGSVNPVARGIEFLAAGNTKGFELSSTEASGEPVAFGEEGNFNAFSPERMFRPVGDSVFDVVFFDPTDQSTPATTRGLGVVFNDFVQSPSEGENDGDTFMEFFGLNGGLLAKYDVLPGVDGGLSFLGVLFDEPEIARVRITAGAGATVADPFGFQNEVVMDDFIFGEPTAVAPIPLPASVLFLGFGLAGLGFAGRNRKAQS